MSRTVNKSFNLACRLAFRPQCDLCHGLGVNYEKSKETCLDLVSVTPTPPSTSPPPPPRFVTLLIFHPHLTFIYPLFYQSSDLFIQYPVTYLPTHPPMYATRLAITETVADSVYLSLRFFTLSLSNISHLYTNSLLTQLTCLSSTQSPAYLPIHPSMYAAHLHIHP